MARIFLDTTVLIDALRGRNAMDRIRVLRTIGDTPYVCAVNVEEVVRGLLPGERHAAERLIAGMRIAPLGREEGARAGRWRHELAKRGRTVSQADCLIAASAVSIEARLATGNPKDFPMHGLEVEHWPVGR